MSTTEEKLLVKGRAGKEAALGLENNASEIVQAILAKFAIKAHGRAISGLLEALDKEDVVTLVNQMVGNSSPKTPGGPSFTQSKVLLSVICMYNTPFYFYFDTSVGNAVVYNYPIDGSSSENICIEN